MTQRHDPEGLRLPIKLDATSNGEFPPRPLTQAEVRIRKLALEQATAHAKKTSVTRRDFMVSLCGAASTLATLNMAHAAAGKPLFFSLPDEAPMDPKAAGAALDKREFIFDVQGHYLRPGGHLAKKAACAGASEILDREYISCLGADSFIKDVFLDSDTDMMVLSFVPSSRESEPLTIEEADATRRIIDEMEGTHRLLIHGRVNPNQPGDLEDMERLAGFGVSAWKTYTQWGPERRGFYMDDDIGIAFVEKARDLNVNNICIHKGIPFGKDSYEHSTCRDIGAIARRFADVNFLIYHSGWVPGVAEGPYDPAREDGADQLITSLKTNGLGKGSNIYAELGSTWRFLSLRDPESAAHLIGKLLVHLGEDNILWGTDSVWYGSPQDQILAFRAFQIPEVLREKYGYPEITPAIRAKIFGLNAMRPYGISIDEMRKRAAGDKITRNRFAYQDRPDPHFRTFGPKTRREFLQLLSLNNGRVV